MTAPRAARRLAAILVSDVVGYARLMAEDESAALAALNRHREAEFDPVVAEHGGRVVKSMGDGALVVFASVVDAVDCAVSIQTAAAARKDGTAGLTLRIGVNLGDVILQGDDIYGDGVNIAARLEPLAPPGGLCVSSIVRESLRDRGGPEFADGGEVEVKSIPRPIRVWRWRPGEDAPPEPARRPAAAKRRESGPAIAVLPFLNMSSDPEQQYFSDGIAEDIITDLGKVSGLAVIARNSSFAYRDRTVAFADIGRELGVDHILDGSVRRGGERVRVTFRLVEAASGRELWADRHDGDLSDIFALQDSVTLTIVEALKVRLSPAERSSLASGGTADPAAHDAFLKMRALFFSPGLDKDLWTRGMEHARKAMELDPRYIEAISLFSTFQWVDYFNGWSGDQPETVAARGMDHAERAVALDPDNPWANAAVAVAARWTGDLERAAAAVERTRARTPDAPLSLFVCADVMIGSGRPREAIPVLERAIRLDPAWTQQHLQFLGIAHFLTGNDETAALMFRERLVLNRGTDIGRAWLAATLARLGEIEEARRVWAELMEIAPGFPIGARLRRFFIGRPQDVSAVMDALALAGLPQAADDAAR